MPKSKEKTGIEPREIARAATNDPALSLSEFTLGDKTFKIVDLAYDDYIKFLALLQPLIEGVVNGANNTSGFDVAGIHVASDGFTVQGILKYCSTELPEMVRIICAAADPTITVEDVKRLGKNPFRLAEIVLKQIAQNKMIQDFASFFQRAMPLLQQAL